MTIIFIRHGDDNESDPSYSHDPKITKNGKKKARRVAFELVEKYGCPDVIFCSPFQRTIQTAKMMRKMCGYSTKIYIDNNLSRYFCSREKANPQVNPSTQKYEAPIYECWDEFEKRVDKHLNMIKHNRYIGDNTKMVWCITHALVYKHVARTYGVTIPVYIPFMHYFLLHEWSTELDKYEIRKRRKHERRRKSKRRHKKNLFN